MTDTVLRAARWLALASYAGLLLVLALWFGWLHPPRAVPTWAALGLALLPLLAALPGLVRGRAYTHAWAALLALGYVAHGIMESMAAPAQGALARAELVLASLFFAAALIVARIEGRRQRLGGAGAGSAEGRRDRS